MNSTPLTASVEKILSPEGRIRIKNALADGFIPLGKVLQALSAEASHARNIAKNMPALMKFLQAHNVNTPLQAPSGKPQAPPSPTPPPESSPSADGDAKPAVNGFHKPRRQTVRRRSTPKAVVDDGLPSEPYSNSSSLVLYMREVTKYPLLTREREVELAKRIQNGDAKAREEMVCSNLRLVVRIARNYENCGLPLMDMISEGNIGLMKAVERFDPSKGAKLSTYASWWIKQAIKRALADQSRTIRIPVHQVDTLFRMRKVTTMLEMTVGREATDEEVAVEMNMDVDSLERLRRSDMRPSSLDAPLNYEADSSCLNELVEDPNVQLAHEQIDDKMYDELVARLMKDLTPREAAILIYRFGLDGGDEKTLDEVGQMFNVTRERIRQIQWTTLNKLHMRIKLQLV